LDRRVWTNKSAQTATSAFGFGIGKFCGMIACFANMFCSPKKMLRTGADTKSATFAKVLVYYDFPHFLPHRFFHGTWELSQLFALEQWLETAWNSRRLSENSALLTLA
jgi:hypothetical protein